MQVSRRQIGGWEREIFFISQLSGNWQSSSALHRNHWRWKQEKRCVTKTSVTKKPKLDPWVTTTTTICWMWNSSHRCLCLPSAECVMHMEAEQRATPFVSPEMNSGAGNRVQLQVRLCYDMMVSFFTLKEWKSISSSGKRYLLVLLFSFLIPRT